MCRPPPTIPRRTVRCNAFTTDSKMPSAPAQLAPAGMPIYPGSCWVSGQPGGETQHFLLHRRFSEHSLFSLASSSPHQNRHRRRSSKSCRRHSTTEHRRQRPTTTARDCSACLKSFSSPASSWFAATGRSRRSHPCTMAPTWSWRDCFVFSKFRWDPGKTQSLLFA